MFVFMLPRYATLSVIIMKWKDSIIKNKIGEEYQFQSRDYNSQRIGQILNLKFFFDRSVQLQNSYIESGLAVFNED